MVGEAMTNSETPTETGISTAAPSTRDLSNVFDALQRPERRTVLSFLHECDADTIELDELGAHVSSRLTGTDETLVRSMLHHHHLPKLADYGFIDYDRTTLVIRPCADVDELLPLFVE
ncbi:hypothetical protein ZOD2009_10595 [Haladaptatus paucihalophilus DX253]|uniref:DUF7344 domain-containing protein n=1 Tax=Haladaptatus paucihalophilus DX253 TaxID=797209 RepID=E7QTJ1_HALPU|nr:hypothetical protein ZOD2009_10595 [Haladaptatus paucihalophilus DX253]